MADKMAAKTWFIMKVAYINVEVVLFSVYFAYICSVFITNYIITFGIIQSFKKFKMAAKIAAEIRFILKMIYIWVINVCI